LLVFICTIIYMADFDVNRRLKFLITDVFKVTPHKFSSKYYDNGGVKTSQVLRERNGLSNKLLEDILSAYPDINKTWLLTGEGEPLRNQNNKTNLIEDPASNFSHAGVPYFEDLDVTASFITSFHDYKEVPTFLIDYKHFNDCDAYLPVVGDSMYPKYSAGEIVAVKQIQSIDTILWGETYLVITNENANNLRTLKDVHFSQDQSKLILRACNPDYMGDTYINKVDIISMFIVKGRIRRNQL